MEIILTILILNNIFLTALIIKLSDKYKKLKHRMHEAENTVDALCIIEIEKQIKLAVDREDYREAARLKELIKNHKVKIRIFKLK